MSQITWSIAHYANDGEINIARIWGNGMVLSIDPLMGVDTHGENLQAADAELIRCGYIRVKPWVTLPSAEQSALVLDAHTPLNAGGVAWVLGVKTSTIHTYRHRGTLPSPDVWLTPDRPGWLPGTIMAWQASRSGRWPSKGAGR